MPVSVELLTEPEVSSFPDWQPMPWGWDPALCKRLLALGVGEEQLPSSAQLEEIRRLSHRVQAVELLPRLQLNDLFCGESFYLTTEEEWQCFVEERDACLLKAPLSGSGKGLNWCKGAFTPFISGWCSRVASLQGGVVAEPVYDKVVDFAMEFISDGKGRITFVGYSLFTTGETGAYAGNLLISDTEIEHQLSRSIPIEALRQLRPVLENELSLRFGTGYAGYLGVDMMICRFSSSLPEYRIHPCVEINLRMNMGIVAHAIYERYIAPGATGQFIITYHPMTGEAVCGHEQMRTKHPLQIASGRVSSGYLPLVPVTKQSKYRAYLLID